MRVKGLPPESAYFNLVHRGEQQAQPSDGDGRHLQVVKFLDDIPVAGSLSEVGKFVNASDDEFSSQAG